MLARIRSRQDIAGNWTTANTLLTAGEIGVELGTDPLVANKFKIGDGVTPWNDLPYAGGGGGGSSAPTILGSRTLPEDITAIGGITPPGGYNQIVYVQGSGGNITITADPQIVSGVNDGELLELRGRNSSQTLKLSNGTGLSLNGSCTLRADSSLWLRWDTMNWVEISRRDNA